MGRNVSIIYQGLDLVNSTSTMEKDTALDQSASTFIHLPLQLFACLQYLAHTTEGKLGIALDGHNSLKWLQNKLEGL